MAVTVGDVVYNKLARPDDLMMTSLMSPNIDNLAPKRKLSELEAAGEDHKDELCMKRSRPNNGPTTNTRINRTRHPPNQPPRKPHRSGFAPIDREYGQQSFIPVFDEDVDDEDDEGAEDDLKDDLYGSSRAALRYLMSVRSEASTIPKLLVAPRLDATECTPDESAYKDDVGDTKGFYDDGAYVAALDTQSETTFSANTSFKLSRGLDAQEGFRIRLQKQYKAFRKAVRQSSAVSLLERLRSASNGGDIEMNAPPETFHDFRIAATTVMPTPTLLYQINGNAHIVRGLRGCKETLKRNKNISKSQSCWIWSLLAKLEEVGTLPHSDVIEVRELGKKAASLQASFLNKSSNDDDNDDESCHEEEKFQDEEEVVSQQDEIDSEDSESMIESVEYTSHEVANSHKVGSDSESSSAQVEHFATYDSAHDAQPTQQANAQDTPDETIQEAKARLMSQLISSPQPSPRSTDRIDKPHHSLKKKNSSKKTSRSARPPHRDGRRRNTSSPPTSRSPSPSLKATPTRAEAERMREGGVVKLSHDDRASSDGVVMEEEPYPDANTRATVDMILMVVGECYGQRDLLEAREIWG